MDKIGNHEPRAPGTETTTRATEQQSFTPDDTTVENFNGELCGSSEAGASYDDQRIEPELGNTSLNPDDSTLSFPDIIAQGASSTEGMLDEASADPEKSSVRNIFDTSLVEPEFEEGTPRYRNPSLDAFKAIFAEAQQIEQQISAAEARLEQDVEPLQIKQILLAFQASKLVAEDRDLANVVDSLLLEAGHKTHGNEKISCSRLVRAIVLQNESKGTAQYKRKKQRATPYASGIDYGIQQGMTKEAFEKELRHPPTPGQSHGIERLAELGVELRRGEANNLVSPPLDLRFTVEGDLSPIPPGDYLMVFRVVPGEPTLGAPLTVPENLFRRVLAAHNKSSRSNNTG